MSRATGRRECVAVVAPGLERLVTGELAALGLAPGTTEPGAVPFVTDDAGVFSANLHLRTASRVLVRVAGFRATAFHELERLAGRVPWNDFVSPGSEVRLRVTCRKSRLYHSDGVAERVAGAITRRVAGVSFAGAAHDDDDTDEAAARVPQLFVVRMLHDACSISADSSGELLHRRGYRLEVAKAPMRETLAAAMLLASGWDGRAPLMDPLCGSGTIPIEAALLARRIAPGARRTFACERWPAAPARAFAASRAQALEQVLPRAPGPILGSDRDTGAISAATANAGRAGVAADIVFRRCALSAIEPPPVPGLLLTNPPYGARVGERNALRSLYAQLGRVARSASAGWTLAFVAADRVLEGQVGLPLEPVLRFRNGGIPVRLVRASVPART